MLMKIINKVSMIKLNRFHKSKWVKKMPLCFNCYGTGYVLFHGELVKCCVCGGTGQTL